MQWNGWSGGTTAANVFLPPVCKHAVSKSRPCLGDITAQHHMTPNLSTQHRHTRLTWLHVVVFFHTGLIFLFLEGGWWLWEGFLCRGLHCKWHLGHVCPLCPVTPWVGNFYSHRGLTSNWFPGLMSSSGNKIIESGRRAWTVQGNILY